MDTVPLSQSKCVACRKGAPTVTDAEVAELHPAVAAWAITEEDGIKRLDRSFKFENFVQALAFANAVGRVAEEEGHHPVIVIDYGRVTLRWWTHKIKGLHRNDFIMAAKTDELFQNAAGQ